MASYKTMRKFSISSCKAYLTPSKSGVVIFLIHFMCITLLRHLSKQDIQGPYSHVAERYIELLCKFEPDSVCTFLKSYDNYRLEEALDVSC